MVTARVGVPPSCALVCGGWDESIDDVEDICLHALSSVHSVFLIVDKIKLCNIIDHMVIKRGGD